MKYRYSGPTSGVTLQNGAEHQEVMLHAGEEVDLPETHEYTRTLLALGHLTPVKQGSKAATRANVSADESAAKGE
ncbi:hypothetical protein [Pandoraea norimbergensis]|uniref:Uncharacterized protein n=1 Tax=Pandoraea norimbergensis TaxID=93219 RepID=A0ABN4JL32_9BURK|nr:hypothetical protein [Pandoraea norimbergensis]ALS60671.1 hypothetical protein AT302_13700 [Pandoraea norimbergensis]ALS61992.1 hypothetical protein AT302_21605 [Pandoraea norimbergensis]